MSERSVEDLVRLYAVKTALIRIRQVDDELLGIAARVQPDVPMTLENCSSIIQTFITNCVRKVVGRSLISLNGTELSILAALLGLPNLEKPRRGKESLCTFITAQYHDANPVAPRVHPKILTDPADLPWSEWSAIARPTADRPAKRPRSASEAVASPPPATRSAEWDLMKNSAVMMDDESVSGAEVESVHVTEGTRVALRRRTPGHDDLFQAPKREVLIETTNRPDDAIGRKAKEDVLRMVTATGMMTTDMIVTRLQIPDPALRVILSDFATKGLITMEGEIVFAC